MKKAYKIKISKKVDKFLEKHGEITKLKNPINNLKKYF